LLPLFLINNERASQHAFYQQVHLVPVLLEVWYQLPCHATQRDVERHETDHMLQGNQSETSQLMVILQKLKKINSYSMPGTSVKPANISSLAEPSQWTIIF